MNSKALTMLSVNGKSLTSELDRAGYAKFGAVLKLTTSFPEAVTVLQSEVCDVIVINVDYEGVDSVQACKHFKSQEATCEIPIILTSVQSRPKSLTPDLSPYDLFVELPIPRQVFVEKIRKLLEQKVRETNRVIIASQVEFTFKEAQYCCDVADLSKSGILLDTGMAIAEGQEIDLSFLLPRYKKLIRVRGEVVRRIKDEKSGVVSAIGVRFKVFQGDSQKRLEKYLSKTDECNLNLAYYL